ncbi:MAG: CDP-alcohol phosphatidyltransferase family protein [Oscillospiraceae bacterium]|nr:CDP-alcohol phosphatidyltransferase family protein [Oscillospiraceae bacterium]
MIIKDWKKEILTIPNLLSLFRLILIPVYVVIYLNATVPNYYYIAGGILAASCLTDLIDGKIARHFNMISNVGKILDPVADKLTQFTLILCLAKSNPVLWVIVTLFVTKESFQLIAMLVFFRRGKMLTGALMTGKICTTILFVSLILMVLMPQLNETAIMIIAIIDGAFLLIAFVDYVLAYFRQTSKLTDVPNEE